MLTTEMTNLRQTMEIVDALKDKAFIAGGMARWLHMGNDAPPPGDIDLFSYYRGAEEAVEALVALGYNHRGKQGNAFLYRREDWELPVQLIQPLETEYSKTFGAPREVISNFGFTTEMFAYEHPGIAIYDDMAVRDTEDKVLRLNHITCPVGINSRIMKYVRKGYSCSMDVHFALMQEWDRRPLEWKWQLLQALQADNRAEFYRLATWD